MDVCFTTSFHLNFLSFMHCCQVRMQSHGEDLERLIKVLVIWKLEGCVLPHFWSCARLWLLKASSPKNRSPCSEKALDVRTPSPPLVGIGIFKNSMLDSKFFSTIFFLNQKPDWVYLLDLLSPYVPSHLVRMEAAGYLICSQYNVGSLLVRVLLFNCRIYYQFLVTVPCLSLLK